tara:strand:- start:1121 stop:2413 length:1293 start_codon:yes stop_codon:yes gene_type:complete
MINYLAFIAAIAIATVAAYYSIIGLTTIFAAAVMPIAIMGGVLEAGKLITASWLYNNRTRIPFLLKSYLIFAVIVLMFITSMGIFGFLSKAHIEQTAESEENIALIQQLDKKLLRLNTTITNAESSIDKIENKDNTRNDEVNEQIATEEERIEKVRDQYQSLVDEQNEIIKNSGSQLKLLEEFIKDQNIKALQSLVGTKVDGNYGPGTSAKVNEFREKEQSRADEIIKDARDRVQELRQKELNEISKSNDVINRLRQSINTDGVDENDVARIKNLQNSIISSEEEIIKLNSEKFNLEAEERKLEAEVGPVKYIAELVYSGEADRAILEDAVRWVIIIIIFVFDPLAVLLLIAANMGWEHAREDRIKKLGRSQNRVAKDGKIVDAVEMTNPIKEEPTRKEKLEKLKEETEKPKKILKKKEVRAGYEYDVDV